MHEVDYQNIYEIADKFKEHHQLTDFEALDLAIKMQKNEDFMAVFVDEHGVVDSLKKIWLTVQRLDS